MTTVSPAAPAAPAATPPMTMIPTSQQTIVVPAGKPGTTRFEYQFAPIGDLEVKMGTNTQNGKPIVDAMLVKDEPIKPSQRFWTSLYARYGFNKAFFKYFDHAEVFQRIAQRESADQMRLCVERHTDENGKVTSTLMAVSNPTKPIVQHEDLVGALEKYNGQDIAYNNGEVYSTHSPRIGGADFKVAGDMFSNRFLMTTPIDGYGAPSFYLSLLRHICQNGLVGYAKVFRSSLNLGKASDDVMPTITRALDGFNNDEGFTALRQRMASASTSWASVHESQILYKLLIKLHNSNGLRKADSRLARGVDLKRLSGLDQTASHTEMEEESDGIGSPIVSAFHRMTGDVNHTYGLANIDALSAKRQRALPVKCTVYDMINFATEVATHYATTAGARKLNGMVGTLISGEFDMEGTKERFGEFADFHTDMEK